MALDYPGVWIEYSCISKRMQAGIFWAAGPTGVHLALMEVDLFSSSSYRWQLQLSSIEEFQRKASSEENARLPEVLSLIPSNALYAP